jgi:hypothetical protein
MDGVLVLLDVEAQEEHGHHNILVLHALAYGVVVGIQ